MNLILRRKKNDGDTTIGLITDGFYKAYTLEDEPREVKVKGETRVDAGTFEIVAKKVLTPLTKKYRDKFSWFKWHLEIIGLPRHKNVYVHIGNDDSDSDACILVGYQTGDWKIWESTAAYRDFYFYIMGALNAGKRVFISIIDEDGN